jgi:putative nucleotidyltransferase with HDIG domain
VLAWLKALLGRRPPSDDPAALTAEEEAAGDAAVEAWRAEQEGRAPPPAALSDRTDAPPEAWATALGVEPAALAGSGEARLGPEEQLVAAAALDHFETHRPGPASFPAISLQVVELTRNPEVALDDLARLVGMDAALSAGVLVLANSPVYRGISAVETPRDAIARLGLAEVSRLVTALSTRSLFRPEVRAEFEAFGPAWNRLFYHSAVVGRTASSLAEARKLPGAEQAFVGGMLHDVGKSIALRSVAALAFEGQIAVPAPASLDRILHHLHLEVGGEVAREWGLPEALAGLVVLHHRPQLPARPELAVLHLVRLASALHLLRAAPGLLPAAPAEIVDSARALGLGPARVEALGRELEENGEWVRLLFGEERGGPAAAR